MARREEGAVLEHRTLGRRDILAQLKRLFVHLADHAVIVDHVVIRVFQAFDEQPPTYAHIPLILNQDGSKMSKRDQGAAVGYYMENGFVPDAVRALLETDQPYRANASSTRRDPRAG